MTEDDHGVPVASMPTIEQEEYMKDHATATRVTNGTPIDQDVMDEAADRLPIEFSLVAIQAAADQYIDDIKTATHITSDGDIDYYTVTSDTFYRLASLAHDDYDQFYIQVEHLQAVIAAHTRQYLVDMHGYTGDFQGRDTRLGNAYNDPTPYDGPVRDETEPEDAHYGFVDARGLVVERGTHTT